MPNNKNVSEYLRINFSEPLSVKMSGASIESDIDQYDWRSYQWIIDELVALGSKFDTVVHHTCIIEDYQKPKADVSVMLKWKSPVKKTLLPIFKYYLCRITNSDLKGSDLFIKEPLDDKKQMNLLNEDINYLLDKRGGKKIKKTMDIIYSDGDKFIVSGSLANKIIKYPSKEPKIIQGRIVCHNIIKRTIILDAKDGRKEIYYHVSQIGSICDVIKTLKPVIAQSIEKLDVSNIIIDSLVGIDIIQDMAMSYGLLFAK